MQDKEGVNISKEEYESLKDKYLRSCAELENTKKRLERERLDSVRYANDSLLLDFYTGFHIQT